MLIDFPRKIWDTCEMSNKKHKHLDKKIDWTNAIKKAENQLNKNKSAIESSTVGTPSNWSRPIFNKPAVTPDQSPPDEKVKRVKLNKQQRKAQNKIFVPQQKKKSKRSDESGGLPIVKKV